MIVKQPEHSGRLVDPAQTDRVANLHDAAARWAAPDSTLAVASSSASNIVLFRRSPSDAAHPAPALAVGPAPLPVAASGGGMRLVALLALSFVAHAAAFSWQLWEAPRPMASIGEVSLSVDLVLGGKEDAGRTPERGVAEASSAAASAQEPEPTPEATTTELAKVESAKPVAAEQPAPIAPAEVWATPPEAVSANTTPREQAREARRRDAVPGERTEASVSTVAAQAAGGAGRGRSDADSNYIGRLSAHLARHQRFPAEARRRGAHGTATVAFSFDADGRVTAVSLQKSSGAAILDQEATAMVQRASPFPLPPGGGGRSFSVPVHFKFKNATSSSR